jgi:hypothetical protein
MKKRTLLNAVTQVSKTFPVLLVTGPRQVGKTTLLEMCAKKNRKYVSLDDLEQRELAKKDPALFLQKNPPPIIIDEVQYAPELFTYIKIYVDKIKKNGLFWLTGSQKFNLMKGINESLAGRVAVIDMLGLSRAEIQDRANKTLPFLPGKKWITKAKSSKPKKKTLMDIYYDIWMGSYPKVVTDKKVNRDLFYKSYLETYIQRDIKDVLKISDELVFNKFIRTVAARTGQILNFSDIARDVDVDHKTVKSWLSVLETSGLIYLLNPYYANTTKRIIKAPKIYFLDTGLCSYLTAWPSPESLESGAMSGAILETYMFTEILKSYWHNLVTPYFYYYKDSDQKEIDLLIEQGDTLYPIEFKKTAMPGINSSRNFYLVEKLNKTIGHGAVICLIKKDMPISRKVDGIPLNYI